MNTIKQNQYGKNLVVVINDVKSTKTIENADEMKALKGKIKSYNDMMYVSKADIIKKDKMFKTISDLFTAKKEVAKVKAKAAEKNDAKKSKKVVIEVKKTIEKVTKTVEAAVKAVATVVASIEDVNEAKKNVEDKPTEFKARTSGSEY